MIYMQMAAINVQRPHWRVALLSVIKTHMIVSLQIGKLISTGKKKVEYFNETYAVSNIKVETLIAFFFFFFFSNHPGSSYKGIFNKRLLKQVDR